MVKYPKVALLIQGPTNNPHRLNFHENIDYYKTLFGEIILSTYTEHVNPLIEEFVEQHKIKLVLSSEVLPPNFENRYNIAYQTLTTLAGIRQSCLPYTVKHRTDERYSNLELLVDTFMKDTNKWVSSTTVFCESSYVKYHAGDHLFIAPTFNMEQCFDKTMIDLTNNRIVYNNIGEPAAEMTFTMNYIRTYGEEPTLERHDELMRKYFEVINDREFMPFVVRIGTKNFVFIDPEQIYADRPVLRRVFNIEDILRN